MNVSNRALRIAFAALTLALASHASAVGLSATDSSPVKDTPLVTGGTTPSESQQRINKSKSNIKNNKLSSDPTVNETPTTTGQPADGKVKGKVTTAQDTGMLGKAAPQTTTAACEAPTKAGVPSSCPKGINEAGIK